jgi:hypothetical protein
MMVLESWTKDYELGDGLKWRLPENFNSYGKNTVT